MATKTKAKTKDFNFNVTVKVNLDDLPEGFEFKKADVAEMIDNAVSEYCNSWADEATGGPTAAGEGLDPDEVDACGFIASTKPEVKVK